MQYIRDSILRHVSVRSYARTGLFLKEGNPCGRLTRQLCALTHTNSDHLMMRVVALVKKYDRIDAVKVTETADFQKDLCLDSLDRVDLVMAFEQEFNIEIPDEKADKLACCADVVQYIMSKDEQKIADKS